MIYGFTGTQHLITVQQAVWGYEMLNADVEAVHHGACIGADYEVHKMALRKGIRVVVHPPTKQNKVAVQCLSRHPLVTVLPPYDYLTRDRHIVDASEKLLALPNGPERTRSGTWYTVRYAVQVRKPVLICHPDGRVETR